MENIFHFLCIWGPGKVLPGAGVSHMVCTPLTWEAVFFQQDSSSLTGSVWPGHWDILTKSQTIISYSSLPGTWPIFFADTAAALTDRDGQEPGFYNAIICMSSSLPSGEVPQLSQGNPWLSETWLISAMQFLQPVGSLESSTASDSVYNF